VSTRKVCILGDQQHCDETKANSVSHMDVEALKKLNQNSFMKLLMLSLSSPRRRNEGGNTENLQDRPTHQLRHTPN